MRLLLGLISFLVMAGCAKKSDDVRIVQKGHDFSVSFISASQVQKLQQQNADIENCFERIERVTCVSQKSDLGFDSECAIGTVQPLIFKNLKRVITQLPLVSQKVFCLLGRIQIQEKLSSIGYASYIRSEASGLRVGTMVGLRPDAVLGQDNVNVWSWKEQLNFGLTEMGDLTYRISELGPRVRDTIPGFASSTLITLLTHEMAHLLDFMNVAHFDQCYPLKTTRPMQIQCEEFEGSFGRLSWPAIYTYINDGIDWPPEKYKARYPWLAQLCYYDCVKFISVQNIKDVYSELRASSFLTAYSSKDPDEDFAEASTVFLLKSKGYRQQIFDKDDNILFDSDAAYSSPQARSKIQWLKKFYANPELIVKVK